MSKATEWSKNYGIRPIFITTETTNIKIAEVADNGCMEFSTDQWPKIEIERLSHSTLRIIPSDAILFAKWILDQFEEN